MAIKRGHQTGWFNSLSLSSVWFFISLSFEKNQTEKDKGNQPYAPTAREARLRGGTITSVPLPLKEMWLWDWHFYNLWSQHVRGDDSREKCQSLGPGACL
tara:strand:- start:88 stop:387 length:300 start_codon:yes stop_codon:yes gene_type:complete